MTQDINLDETNTSVSNTEVTDNDNAVINDEILAAQKAEQDEKDYQATLKKENDALAAILEHDPDFTPKEFDNTFMEFFSQNPFFGALTMEITKVFDVKQPTAYIGVRLNGRSHEIVMGINPKFFRELQRKERQGILKHELYHMIFQHIFSRAIGDSNYARMHNFATDLAINSLIGQENLPKMVLMPGQRPLTYATVKDANGKDIIDPVTKQPKIDKSKLVPVPGPYADFIEKAKVNESSDYYFEELRKIQDQQNDENGEGAASVGLGTIDDHENWKNLPTEVQEQIRDKIRELVAKGVMKADRDNSWGDIPQEIQEQIRKMVSSEVDWRSIVKNFIGRTRSMERNSTVRKINKKMPYIQPGVKRPNKPKFVVFLDQSGSMSDLDIALLFGEFENLATLTEIDVYHFDTEIDVKSKTTWKKGKPFPKAHRTRCGGTDFQAVADFVNSKDIKNKYDSVILCSDGYAPTMGTTPGTKVLWVITETGTVESCRPGDLVVKMKANKQAKKI